MTEQYGGFFMLRKLSAFILLSTSVGAVAYAQQTAESHPFPERAIQRFFYSASENGSYLGVQTQEVTKENFSRFGLRQVRGVAVEKVLENSPAAQAGLQPNDVIVRFNGEEVTGTRKLTRLISEVAPDHQARLTISRGGNEREITVTIGKRELPKMQTAGGTLRDLESLQNIPDIPSFPGVIVPPAPGAPERPGEPQVFVFPGQASRQIGVGVSPLTKQLGEYFGAAEGQGLLINNVRENSPAAKAGLKAGDVIVQIDGKDVKGNLDLIRTLNEKKDGDVSLTIIRDRNRQTIRVTPESVKSETLNFENHFDKIGENILPLKLKVKPGAPVAPAPPVFFAPDVL
ncbi:MAG: trypsin-like serine protease with C-terminal domain [Acidobacteria bacterium]|nr:trypsin-like serine protease with C-terminal domain [Acidobacteriota bacterium]